MITSSELDLIARELAETLTGRESTDPVADDVARTDATPEPEGEGRRG